MAGKLRKQISEHSFLVDAATLHITASFGVSLLEAGKDSKSYFSRVDKALYQAKNNGKNRIKIERTKCPSRFFLKSNNGHLFTVTHRNH